jgi:hypothetical protein
LRVADADRGLTEFDIAHQLGNSPEVCRETYIHTHVDRANERIQMALDTKVNDLQAARRRRRWVASVGSKPASRAS